MDTVYLCVFYKLNFQLIQSGKHAHSFQTHLNIYLCLGGGSVDVENLLWEDFCSQRLCFLWSYGTVSKIAASWSAK